MCWQSICQVQTEHLSKRWLHNKNLPIIPIKFEQTTVQALIDSGSMIPLLAESIYQKIKRSPQFNEESMFSEKGLEAYSCNGGQLDIPGVVTGKLLLHEHDTPIKAQFYILKQSTQECILPHTWLSKIKAVLDYNTSSFTYELPPNASTLTADGNLEIEEIEQEPNDNIKDTEITSTLTVKKPFCIPSKGCKTVVLPNIPQWPACVQLPNKQGHGFVRRNRTGSNQILTLFNTTTQPIWIDRDTPVQPVQNPRHRTVPTKIATWAVIPSQRREDTSDQPTPIESIKEALQQNQSQFDHHTKDIKYLPIENKKIDFLVPSTLDKHPFNDQSDSLTILYAYLFHLIGSNLQYMNKTPEELERIVYQINWSYQKQLLKRIKACYDSAKIQQMYLQMSLHLIHQVHKVFLKYQTKHTNTKKDLPTRNYLQKAVKLNGDMVLEIKGLTCLYFLNQLLINTFYETTLKHPYFQKLELPNTLQEVVQNLQREEDATTTTNAVQLETPIHITTKQAFQETIRAPLDPYQPKELNFQEYKKATHEACEQYTQAYQQELQKQQNPLRPPPQNIAEVPKEQLDEFISYNKSQSRLADFVREQIPQGNQNEHDPRTVTEILNDIPYPKWVYYSTKEEIVKDYIPRCLVQQYQEFYALFSDPVFTRFASEFPLPYPPTETLLQTDPPDTLHSDNGLVDSKVLAATASQFLSYDHILFKSGFEKELTLLACTMFIYGQTGLSLHALDTGMFKRQFEVKTLLASTAPTSSFPSKQATENVSVDLDERLEYLKNQNKVAEILGSPFLTQLSSVPKNYKTGTILHSTRTDPVLQYIASLPVQEKEQLAKRSTDISAYQQQLIEKLNESFDHSVPPTEYTEDKTDYYSKPNVENTKISSSQVLVHRNTLLEQNLKRISIYDIESKVYIFQSEEPPTDQDKITFHRVLSTNSKKKVQKVTFGHAYVLTFKDPQDLREYRKRVPYSQYYEDYFLTKEDFERQHIKQNYQTMGIHSKHILNATSSLSSTSKVLQDKTPIKYLSQQFPNIGQLASNKLDLRIAEHQKYLAACNNVHFAILQFSSQAPQNKLADEEDPNYQLMRELATDPKYLLQTHADNLTNAAPQQLVTLCMTLTTQSVSKNNSNVKNWDHSEERTLGKIQLKRHNTQNFAHFISTLNTTMRQIDHKRALRTAHSIKQNTVEVLAKIQPKLQEHWSTLTIADILANYLGWEPFLEDISAHYQIPMVWVYVEVKQNRRLFQETYITHIHVTHANLYDPKKQAFAGIAINQMTKEFYRFRPVTDKIVHIIEQVAHGNLKAVSSIQEILHPLEATHQNNLQIQEYGNYSEEQVPTLKPRYTKTSYPHVGKSFYQKNAITRYILCSRDTNKLTRPVNTQLQSQNSIIHNLGSSELFSNYDLTAAYDAVPACPISSLINTASYRQKEYALLIASMGGSNSVLYCQRAVTSLMHRVNDQLLLRPCYAPSPVTNISPKLESEIEYRKPRENSVTIDQSWSGDPQLHLPAPKLIKEVQNWLMFHPRDYTPKHNLPMSQEQRKRMLQQGSEDHILSTSALIDDLVCSSKAPNSVEYQNLTLQQQQRVHLQIHILTLQAIFQAINLLSQDPGPGPKYKASLKLKLEKSTFATDSIRYLNLIYIKGFQVINLNNFKKSCKYIDTLPSHGDELRSAMGFFNFLLSFCKALRYHMKHLEAFATKYPAKKAIKWDEHPKLRTQYDTLCKVIKASNCLQTLPADLNQLGKVVYNADACSASVAYLVGFVLKPVDKGDDEPLRIKPLKFHSAKLPTYCLNLTILLKETVSAVLCLSQELPTLKLLPTGCKKYLIMDSKPLFDLMTGYLKNGQLNTFFTAHSSIPLWLTRLYQITSCYNIQILLMPTKLAPPADFLTRKDHEPRMCQSTTQRTTCVLCEGCKVHCIRTNPHTNCPFSIGNAPDTEPSLIDFDHTEDKTVTIDNKTFNFKITEASPVWEEYIPVQLSTYLSTQGATYDQSIEEMQLDSLFYEDTDIKSMLDNSNTKVADIQEATQALHQIRQIVNVVQRPRPRLQTMPDNIYITGEYFPRDLHTLKFPANTAVIHFTTQRKTWNRSKTYISRMLADTAIGRIEFNIGQIEGVIIHETNYIVMCVSTSSTEPYAPLETLFSNLSACIDKAQGEGAKYIVYDYNSIAQLHRVNQYLLAQALSMLALGSTTGTSCNLQPVHQIYMGYPTTVLKEPHANLMMTAPLIHNQVRKNVISVKIKHTLQPSLALSNLHQKLTQEINCHLPIQDTTDRKIGIMIGRTVQPLTTTSDLPKVQLILVKDKIRKDTPTIQTVRVKYKQDVLFILELPTVSSNQHSENGGKEYDTEKNLQQEIKDKTNRTYTSFQIFIKKPLESKYCTNIRNFKKYTQPILSTRITLKELTHMIRDYPEITTITLRGQLNPSTNTASIQSNLNQADILRQLLGVYSNTLIAQASDQKIQEIVKEIETKNTTVVIGNCTFQVFENILFGKLTSPTTVASTKEATNYKPVIAESQIITEILKTHQMLKCGRTAKVISDIRARYFHKYGVTSEFTLENLCNILLPCHVCTLGRASHVRAPLYLETQTIGLQCLGVKACTYTVMDVIYLTNTDTPSFRHPYISIIMCQSCKFLSLQSIPRISSDNLASHLLQFCQLTGKIQTVLISDAASTQVAGEMKKILKDFQLIHVTANQRIMSTHTQGYPTTDTPTPTETEGDDFPFTNTHEGIALDQITPKHRKLLLQDVQTATPALYNSVRTHNPVSYKSSDSSTETSMGSLDNLCKRLQIFLKKFLLDVPPDSTMQDHVENLINSFVYLNNFKMKAAFTNQIPAKIHLGLIRSNNILTMMDNIQELHQPDSQAIHNMQQLLQYAETFRQAEITAQEVHTNQKARQLRQHGKILDEEQLINDLKLFSVIYVKSELGKVPKMHFYAQHCGPFLVLSVNPKSKSVYLYSLLSGQIHKKSYRQIKLAFRKEIFSLPIFGQLGEDVQFRMIENFSYFTKVSSADEIMSNVQRILINLHKLLSFLKPILPTLRDLTTTLQLTLNETEDQVDEDPSPQTEKTPSTTLKPRLDPVEPNVEDTTNRDYTDKDNQGTQDKRVRFTFQGEVPEENQIKDSIPRKPKRAMLHEIPEQRSNNEESPGTTKKSTDARFTPSRPKETPSKEDLPNDRGAKYTLRENPRKNTHPDFI